MQPILYVIAGPNGVGRTTFANRYLPEQVRQLQFVNADLIAKGLSPYNPELAALDAGKIALRRIQHLISKGAGFTCETTLSGRTTVNWMKKARAAGFLVKGHFLWVREPEILLRRIRQRVAMGGHNISEKVSRRRFLTTLRHFRHVYSPMMHDWKFYENDSPGPRLVAIQKRERLVIRDPSAWNEVTSLVG